MTGIPHGTVNGYNNYSCRCLSCRAAYSEYHRRRLATQRAKGFRDYPHGVRSTYRAGCQCSPCRDSHRLYMRDLRAKRRATS